VADYAQLEAMLGYTFRDRGLLEQALRHASWCNEHPADSAEDNERLEFLGDSVLGLVITEELYKLLPDQAELDEIPESLADLVEQRSGGDRADDGVRRLPAELLGQLEPQEQPHLQRQQARHRNRRSLATDRAEEGRAEREPGRGEPKHEQDPEAAVPGLVQVCQADPGHGVGEHVSDRVPGDHTAPGETERASPAHGRPA